MRSRSASMIMFAALALVVTLCASCGSNNPASPSAASVCFGVSGFHVTVYHVWRDGSTQNENVQGLISFTSTVSSNNETHVFEWTNIVNNYTSYTTTSFNVRIDGVSYSFPANRCP